MKIIFLCFLLFLIACGGKKEELVDLKSFTNQGEKIVLVQKKNLNFIDIKIINNLKKLNIIHIKTGLNLTKTKRI